MIIKEVFSSFHSLFLLNRRAAINFLVNCIRIRIGCNENKWLIRGNEYWFRDEKQSRATPIIHKEIIEGIYNPLSPLCKNDNVLDIGAHVGMFSIPLARENPSCQFIAVEPDIVNYSNLIYNIKRNNIKNITPIRAAISNKHGAVGLVALESENTGSKRIINGNSTECYTLDSLRKALNLKTIKLMKIDVEGHEGHILVDDNSLQGVNGLIIEMHNSLIVETKEINRLYNIIHSVNNRIKVV